jgi:protein tyrosine/serine phosphatase
VARVLAIINDPENQPVFVHCNHGSNRTGTIVACYRISQERWTGKRAIEEAKRYGMSWIQFSMKDYISDYYRDRGLPKRGREAGK